MLGDRPGSMVLVESRRNPRPGPRGSRSMEFLHFFLDLLLGWCYLLARSGKTRMLELHLRRSTGHPRPRESLYF